MTLWDEIRRRRKWGRVRTGLFLGRFEDPDTAARVFNLDPSGINRFLEPAEAKRLVRRLLEADLAYQNAMMSPEDASRLTEAFADEAKIDKTGTRILSNLDFRLFDSQGALTAWTPATEGTFDTGVLVIARDRCACLWVEDGD